MPELPDIPHPECAELPPDSTAGDHREMRPQSIHQESVHSTKEKKVTDHSNDSEQEISLLSSPDGIILRGNMDGSIDGTTHRGNVMDFMKYERGSYVETSHQKSTFPINNVPLPPKPEINIIPPSA